MKYERFVAHERLLVGGTMVLGLLAFLLVLCTPDSYTGVSEVGNPSDKVSISGVIYGSNGMPVENITLRLFPSTFNPAIDSPLFISFLDTTGERGDFRISDIPHGVYTLNGSSRGNDLISFLPDIDLRTGKEKTIRDTVREPGTGMIYLPWSVIGESKVVLVRGTDKSTPAVTREVFMGDFLEKQLDYLNLFDANTGKTLEVSTDTTIRTFFISPDSTIQFEYTPNAPIGPIEVSRDTPGIYRASRDPFPPYKDCKGEEMFRMAWGNGDTSEWKTGFEFTSRWSSPGTYFVQSQTRCETALEAGDVKLLSRWSDSLRVTVIE